MRKFLNRVKNRVKMKTHSEIKVTPKTWEKSIKSNLEKTWEIYYTFYDRNHPEGIKVRFKGMNRAKTLEEKQEITRTMIANEIKNLERGYNPITNEYVVEDEHLVSEFTPFVKACEIALKSFHGVESTIIDLNNSMKHIINYATILRLENKELKNITKGDIKQLLMKMTIDKHSNYRVNKTRAHLSKFFAHFTELDIFQVNFSYPYQVQTFAKQFIYRSSNLTKRSLITSCLLVNSVRSDNNPQGFTMEKFNVIENKDIETVDR